MNIGDLHVELRPLLRAEELAEDEDAEDEAEQELRLKESVAVTAAAAAAATASCLEGDLPPLLWLPFDSAAVRSRRLPSAEEGSNKLRLRRGYTLQKH